MIRVFLKAWFFACFVGIGVGCGGSGGGSGGSIPTGIDILAHAPTAGQGQGISQLAGFVGGKPAFLSFQDASHWTVDVVGQSTVSLSTTDFANAFLVAFDNGIAVGGYDGGTFTYRLTTSGWVATTFAGLSSPVLDTPKAHLIGQTTTGYAIGDVAAGTQTPLSLPANSTLYFAKSDWLVYGLSGNFLVRNVQTAAEWQETPIPGDTAMFPFAMNASGGVVGNSGDGTNGRAVYWAPTTGAPHVLGSFPNGTVEPGWISPDGRKFVVNVSTDVFRSYVYVNNLQYPVSALQGGAAVHYLFGFDDSGQKGFGFTDPSADPTTGVAVGITYR